MLTISNVFLRFLTYVRNDKNCDSVIPTEHSDEGSLTIAHNNLLTLYKTKKMPVVLLLTFWQIMSD